MISFQSFELRFCFSILNELSILDLIQHQHMCDRKYEKWLENLQ